MAIKILMPSLSPTMTKGKIAKWNLKEGDKVNIGDVIADIETDKATMEFETADDGIMGKIIFPTGSEVEVGTLIAWIMESENDVIPEEDMKVSEANNTDVGDTDDLGNKAAPGTTLQTSPELKPPVHDKGSKDLTITKNAGKNMSSTPAARARAKELGIDIVKIIGTSFGTGPLGRIQEADVVRYSKTDVTKENTVTHIATCPSGMQKVIAERVTKSKTTVPHFYLEISVCIDELQKCRASSQLHNVKTTLTHWFIMAAGNALRMVPEVNASWSDDDDMIHKYQTSDIALAVSIDPDGLLTPVIRDVCSMRIGELVEKTNELVNRAKAGKLVPHEYQGGSTTISNLGMYGIDRFSAIINIPQATILAIGAARDEIYLNSVGQVCSRKVVACTLSADHRVVNGASAARFLQQFKLVAENPLLILI